MQRLIFDITIKTTTGDFQMDIAETNDELRVKVESLVKMIKR